MQLASTVVATDVHRGARALAVQMGESRRIDAELIAKSRLAVSRSFAALARVPDLSFTGQFLHVSEVEAGQPEDDETAGWSSRAWVGLEARSELRFFFDVDDGEVLRTDDVGVVLASEDDVPRETKSILFDLAQAAIPKERPRLFTARVRNQDGEPIYEGSMKMNPLPARRIDGRI